jgi:Mg-chelatase subunit ChlD
MLREMKEQLNVNIKKLRFIRRERRSQMKEKENRSLLMLVVDTSRRMSC